MSFKKKKPELAEKEKASIAGEHNTNDRCSQKKLKELEEISAKVKKSLVPQDI